LTSDGAQVNAARMLACSIMASMEMEGYDLAGSVDMSIGRGEDHGDCERCGFATHYCFSPVPLGCVISG
jgi:hypothetical protein